MKRTAVATAFLLAALILPLRAEQDVEYALSLYEAGSYGLAYQTFSALYDSLASDRDRMQVGYYMAMCRFMRSEYRLAEDLIYSQMKIYPVNPYKTEMLFVLAEIDERQANLVPAIRQYQKLIRRFPRSLEAFRSSLRVAEIYGRLGRSMEAEDTLRKLLKKTPAQKQKTEVLFALAGLLDADDRPEEAMEAYQGIVLGSADIAAIGLSQYRMAGIRLRQERYEEALDRYSKLLQKFPDSDFRPRAEYETAFCLQKLSRFDESVTAYASVRTAGDTNLGLNIRYRLAEIALAQGRSGYGLTNLILVSTNRYNRSLAEDASRDLVELHLAAAEYTDALVCLSRVTNRLFVLSRRASIRYRTGDYTNALGDYLAYFSATPDSEVRDEQVFFLGKLYSALGNWPEGRQKFRQIYETMPSSRYLEESIYLMADCSIRMKDFDDALIVLNRLLQRTSDPGWKLKARESIALAYFYKEHFRDAADEYQRLTLSSPSNRTWYLYNAGLCYLRLDQPDRAVQLLSQAVSNVSTAPSWSLAWRKLADTLQDTKRYADYVSLLKRIIATLAAGQDREALTEELLNAEFQRAGDYAVFLRDTGLYLESLTNLDRRIRIVRLKGMACFNAADFASALNAYGLVRTLGQGTPVADRVLYDIAGCRLRLGQVDEAEKSYRLFIESGVDAALSAEAEFSLGQYFYRDRNYRKALDYLTRLILDFPGSPLTDKALYWSALSRINQGDYTNASSDLEGVVAHYGSSELMDIVLFRLGDCAAAVGNFPQAVVYYRRLLRDYPASTVVANCRLRLANVYEKMNNRQAALEIYKSLSSASGGGDEAGLGASLDLAVYYRKEGNYPEALRILRSLQSRGYRPTDVAYNLADCLRLTADFTNARIQYAKLIADGAGDRTAECLYYLGFCLERLNNRPAAADYYRKTADLFPESEWGRTARVKLEKLIQKE